MNIKKTLLVFLSLVILSPWFLIFYKNRTLIFKEKLIFFEPQNQIIINEINTLRGQAAEKQDNFLGKLTVNKIFWNAKEIITRFLESYDLHYLFVEGDLDILKSTKTSGPLYLSLLPLIIYGFYSYFKYKTYWPILIFFTPIFGSVIDQHYETLSRLPFILGLTWVAAFGFICFSNNRGKIFLKTFIICFYLYEFFRFIHFYFIHYPFSLTN